MEGLINAEVDFEQIENRSQQNCFYAQGDETDTRQSPNKLAQALKSVGIGRKGLPSEENVLSSGARLAKVYLADVDGMDFRGPTNLGFLVPLVHLWKGSTKRVNGYLSKRQSPSLVHLSSL